MAGSPASPRLRTCRQNQVFAPYSKDMSLAATDQRTGRHLGGFAPDARLSRNFGWTGGSPPPDPALFPDAEPAEDLSQQFIAGHIAHHLAQFALRLAQFERGQLGLLATQLH